MQGQEPIKHYFTQMSTHTYKHTDTHPHFHNQINPSSCTKYALRKKSEKHFSYFSVPKVNNTQQGFIAQRFN